MIRNVTPALAAGLILSLGLAACQQPGAGGDVAKTDAAAVEKALKDNEAQWNADYKAKDVAKIVAHYAPDAVLMAPGEPVAAGADAVKAAITGMTADPTLDLRFEADKVGASGDMAYTRGHYTMTATDPKTGKPATETGSYVTIYKKQTDGSWKAIEDIASTGAPAPAAPPPKG